MMQICDTYNQKHSLFNAMNRFIGAVNNMDQTVMVPSLLRDVPLADPGLHTVLSKLTRKANILTNRYKQEIRLRQLGPPEAWRPRLPSTLFDPSHPLSFLKAFFLFFLAGGREGQTANWGAAYVQEARWGCVEEGASCEREENGGRRGEGPRNLLGGGLHSMLVGMGLG
uniref:Macaca fascicularis brain cDNA clone: QmoA-10795, similar to human MID1 interacting G12-like protein (MIG12), mRNA, RefSeq: NM_021242.3 n=1 Tax=Macaca fascicularis TaxID=9541 RepID=I7GH64_MACFA|nr:unnamed protein product [Macaca fascicularis]